MEQKASVANARHRNLYVCVCVCGRKRMFVASRRDDKMRDNVIRVLLNRCLWEKEKNIKNGEKALRNMFIKKKKKKCVVTTFIRVENYYLTCTRNVYIYTLRIHLTIAPLWTLDGSDIFLTKKILCFRRITTVMDVIRNARECDWRATSTFMLLSISHFESELSRDQNR